MEVVVLVPFGNFQFGFWLESFGAQVFLCQQLGMEYGSFGMSFSYPCSHLQLGDLFPLKASFISGYKNSTTLDALLYTFTHYHSVSELLGRTTHHMLIVWRFECVGK